MSRPHRLTRWAGLAAATVVAAAGPIVGVASPASAAACSGTGSGVTVVVGSSVDCAGGVPATALAALRAAGHSTVMVSRIPAALCRIDGVPASDPCVVMPPSSAYWSLWTATRGGSWVFASTGVGSDHPAPGTVVGFAFGAGDPPAVRPPAPAPAPRASSAPKPTKRPTATPSRTSTSPRTAAATPETTGGDRGSAPTSPAKQAPPAGAAAPDLARTPTELRDSAAPTATDVGRGSLDDAAPASSTSALGSSSPWALLGGAVLALALGGATAYAVRRRRG